MIDELRERTRSRSSRPVPGAPWSDGTIGGMLGRNTAYQINHLHACPEGLASDSLRMERSASGLPSEDSYEE